LALFQGAKRLILGGLKSPIRVLILLPEDRLFKRQDEARYARCFVISCEPHQ